MAKFVFEHQNTLFNLNNAYSLARASNLAYSDSNIIVETAKSQWDMENVICFDDALSGTQGYVMTNQSIIITAFRGTQITRPEDISTDLSFLLVNGPLGGMVHEGFLNAVDRVWSTLVEAISCCRTHPKSLWFTGHSLGAALATVAVAKLRDTDHPVDGLYTFGQPRTGDRLFARNFNALFGKYCFRFVNNNDVVTRIPPRELDYSHVGTLKYFTKHGQLVDDMSFWNRFLDRIYGRMDDFGVWGTDGLKDHDMTNYVSLLEGVMP